MRTYPALLRARCSDRNVRRAGLFLVASFAGYLLVRWLTHSSSFDLNVYRAEGEAIRRGYDLYAPLPGAHRALATYPPFAAIVFVPFTALPLVPLHVVVLGANLVLLVVVCRLSCVLVGVERERLAATACTLAGVAVWMEPVYTSLRYGQINLALLALVLWDFTRPAGSRTRGVGIGLAAALKLTPVVFIGYLLLTRRLRAAATAVLSLAGCVGASALIAPRATWRYWTVLVFRSDRIGRLENAANQSLRGWEVRAEHSRITGHAGLALIALVFLLGMGTAVVAHRRLGERWGVTACAVTGLLCAPIAWSHHWVWCVPIALLLWVEHRRLAPVAVVFFTFAPWLLPHSAATSPELRYDRLQMIVSGCYVVFGLLFLGVCLSRSLRRRSLGRGAQPTSGRLDSVHGASAEP